MMIGLNTKRTIHLDKITAMTFTAILMASTGSAYGQYYVGSGGHVGECVFTDGYVYMQKFSNDHYICVFETSVETLVERNYAYLTDYWKGICPTSESTHEEWSANVTCLITNHPQFLIRDGIPDTLYHGITFSVESLPPWIYGRGYFESEDTAYNFWYIYHKDSLPKFDVDDGTKIP